MSFMKNLSQSQADSDQDLSEAATAQHSQFNPSTDSQGFFNELDRDFEDFSDIFYDNIEEFLDNEGLHLSSDCTFSSLTQTILKPFSNMKKIKSLTIAPTKRRLNSEQLDDPEFDLSSIPSFLAKRTISAEINIDGNTF